MRLGMLFLGAFGVLYAQSCVPARILPAATVSGTLDQSSCALSDGSAYSAYRLDLPVRGRIQISLSPGSADLTLILRDAAGVRTGSGLNIQQPVEAGSYTLLVNGRPGGQPGAYSIHSAFTATAGMLCSSFPSAGLNQAIDGVLGASGCTAPDGTPFEAYLLNTFGAGILTVSVSSSDFATALTVRGQDGQILASGPASISLLVDRDSQYQIVVAGGDTSGKAGAYQLTTSFKPAGAETCRAKMTMADSGKDNASITPDSCTTTLGSGDLGFYNYYSITVPAAGLADVSVSSQDFDPSLHLLDDGGNVLALNTDGAV